MSGRRAWRRRQTVVMSCTAEVVADPGAPDAVLDAAVARLHELAARWSRFLPDSDVSRLNTAGGRAVRVDPSTLELLVAMTAGTLATAGAFDPSLLDVMVGFGRAPAWARPARVGAAAVAPPRRRWFDDVRIDREAGTALLPPGIHLDPGGIGKGLAADLVAADLVTAGVSAVLVNVGGDLRVAGPPPSGSGWRIGIGAVEQDRSPLETIGLAAGGVATSGTVRRPLSDVDGRHVGHVIDPRTRRPSERQLVQASVAAGSAAWAEVMTKAVLVRGPVAALEQGAAAMWVDASGTTGCTEAWAALR